MEKVIKFIMNPNRSISITVNGEEKLIISENNRKVSADKIYELLNFSIGDTYKTEKQNDANIDPNVLDFFADLIEKIVEKINEIKPDV
jgi:hypothetical protein